MNSTFRSWLRHLFAGPKPIRRPIRKSVRLSLLALEDRAVPAVISSVVDNGAWTLTCDGANDKIEVQHYASGATEGNAATYRYRSFEVEGGVKTYGAWNYQSGVRSIVVEGNGGDDVINLLYSPHAALESYTVNGGDGNDTISAGTTASYGYTFNGGDGNDTITGNSGDDVISGGAGNDTIDGRAGNDTILAGKGDKVNGGAGTDTVELLYTPQELDALTDLDIDATQAYLAAPSSTTVTLSTNSGIENFVGKLSVTTEGETFDVTACFAGIGGAANIIVGTDGHDSGLNGTSGIDLIFGLGGNDIINGGAGADWVFGGSGADEITGGSGADILRGNAGNDKFLYSGSNVSAIDTVYGGAGDDTIEATADITVIGLGASFGPANSIETISGGSYSNVTVQPTSASAVANVWDFSGVAIENIAVIDSLGGADTITTSDLSEATYRGGAGEDTFILSKEMSATLLYTGVPSSSGDTFVGNVVGDAVVHTAKATADGSVIHLGASYGGTGSVDVITAAGKANVTIGQTTAGAVNNVWDFSSTQLVGIMAVNAGGGNDVVTTSSEHTVPTRYDGGSGVDSIVLVLTPQQLDAVQNAGELGALLGYLAAPSGKTLNGTPGPNNFVVNALPNLSAANFESGALRVVINGQVLDLGAWLTATTNVIVGTEGDNGLTGTDGNDLIFGLGGKDSINPKGGDDYVVAGPGDDTIYDSNGSDTYLVLPGDGFDTYVNYHGITDDGFDVVKAAVPNTDIGLAALTATAGVEGFVGNGTTRIVNTDLDATLNFSNVVFTSIAYVDAGGGNDVVTASNFSAAEYRGGVGNDTMYGGSQNDLLDGGEGDDTLSGGAGDDTLIGGPGKDKMNGGAGTNTIEDLDSVSL